MKEIQVLREDQSPKHPLLLRLIVPLVPRHPARFVTILDSVVVTELVTSTIENVFGTSGYQKAVTKNAQRKSSATR